MSQYPLPRGIRNNNPGNIRKSHNPWKGKKPVSEDPDFEQFDHPRYGIRALGVLLQTYYNAYHLDNITALVSRFAPTSENDTRAYITHIAQTLNVGEKQAINVNNERVLLPLMLGIIRHENKGLQPYSVEVINEALDMIGSS